MLEKLDIVTRCKVLEMALDIAARHRVEARTEEIMNDSVVEQLVEGLKSLGLEIF